MLFLVATNLKTIFAEANLFQRKNHSEPQYVVLGELKDMRNYIIKETQNSPTVYMLGVGKYMQNYYKPLLYVLSEKNVILLREQKTPENVPAGEKLFYLGGNDGGLETEIYGYKTEKYRNFGEIGIYILENNKKQ